MLNFSLRFLGQSTKLLFRIGTALGGVLLFSFFRLIIDYFLVASNENEVDTGMTIDEAYESGIVGEDELPGTLTNTKLF